MFMRLFPKKYYSYHEGNKESGKAEGPTEILLYVPHHVLTEHLFQLAPEMCGMYETGSDPIQEKNNNLNYFLLN